MHAMHDYRTMTPCERFTYYGREIRRLTPPGTRRERLLIEVFRVLVAENEPLCAPDNTDGQTGFQS